MRQTLHELAVGLLGTVRDVAPIAVVLLGFQLFVLRRRGPHLRRVLVGFGLVLVGMVLFLARLAARSTCYRRIFLADPLRRWIIWRVSPGPSTPVRVRARRAAR